MDKKFTSGDVPLVDLLDQAGNGTLQLPDFQRGWVWDDNHVTSLLASVSLSYPIGAVMTLRTGNPDVKFKPRFIEGVTLPSEPEPGKVAPSGVKSQRECCSPRQARARPVEAPRQDGWGGGTGAPCPGYVQASVLTEEHL